MALGHENIRRTRFWRAVVAEFIGSVFIVAVGCGTWTAGINGGETAASQTDNLDSVTSLSTKGKLAVIDGIPLQPSTLKVSIAFGLTYVAVLYCSRSVGDAHINPGVTVALLATRRVSFARGVLYLVAQLAGAVLGAATALIVTAGTGSPFLMSDGKRWLTASAGGCTVPARKLTEGQGFGVEFIASFFFVFVVFACHDKRKNPPGFYQDGNGNNFSTEAEMKASCIARKDRRLLEYREDPFVIGLTYTALSLFAVSFSLGLWFHCMHRSHYDKMRKSVLIRISCVF